MTFSKARRLELSSVTQSAAPWTTGRGDILRGAFNATMKDPEFLAEMKKSRLEVNPLTGGEMEVIVKKLFQMDAKNVAKIREILIPKN